MNYENKTNTWFDFSAQPALAEADGAEAKAHYQEETNHGILGDSEEGDEEIEGQGTFLVNQIIQTGFKKFVHKIDEEDLSKNTKKMHDTRVRTQNNINIDEIVELAPQKSYNHLKSY